MDLRGGVPGVDTDPFEDGQATRTTADDTDTDRRERPTEVTRPMSWRGTMDCLNVNHGTAKTIATEPLEPWPPAVTT